MTLNKQQGKDAPSPATPGMEQSNKGLQCIIVIQPIIRVRQPNIQRRSLLPMNKPIIQ
jgi:hypothetical protein